MGKKDDKDKSRTNDGDVLKGPKHPMWECKPCGETRNFASRIRCRCGQAAPKHIKRKAINAAKAFEASEPANPLPQSNRRVQGTSSSDGINRKMQHQVAALSKQLEASRKEVEDLRNAVEESSSDEDDDMEESDPVPTPEQVDRLQSMYNISVETYGSQHAFSQQILLDLEVARKRRAESKPLDVRVRNLESKLKQKASQLEKAEASEKEANQKLKDAQSAVDEATKLVGEHKSKKAEIEAELAKLRRLQVDGAMEEATVTSESDLFLIWLHKSIGDEPEVQAIKDKLKRKADELAKEAAAQAVAQQPNVDNTAKAEAEAAKAAAPTLAAPEEDPQLEAKRQKVVETDVENILKAVHQSVIDAFKAKQSAKPSEEDDVAATQDYSNVGYEAVLGYKSKLIDSMRKGPYARPPASSRQREPYG